MAFIIQDNIGNLWSEVVDASTGALLLTPVANVTPSVADNSITTNAVTLITSALRLIGVLASGETPDANAASDSLMVLQQMFDAWNADRLAIYTTTASDYALIVGKQSYTLGPGGDWNTNRPPCIDSMSAILLSNPANPIEVPLQIYTVDDWQNNLPVKKVNGTFPLICYDDGGYPLRTLNFWPIPGELDSIRIYAWQSLTVPQNLQAAISYPPGYAEAFRYNLAVRLSAEFAAPVSPTVQGIAIESLARLKSMNAPDKTLRSDLLPGPGGYNYRADLFGLGW
jgi:hypothetical protein